MTTLTTNRFLTKALRLTCCVAALTACSAWAAVVNWQLSPIGANSSVGAIKDLSQPGYTNTARGLDNRAVTDASHQVVFERAPETAAATLADALNENPKTRATDEAVRVGPVSRERSNLYRHTASGFCFWSSTSRPSPLCNLAVPLLMLSMKNSCQFRPSSSPQWLRVRRTYPDRPWPLSVSIPLPFRR